MDYAGLPGALFVTRCTVCRYQFKVKLFDTEAEMTHHFQHNKSNKFVIPLTLNKYGIKVCKTHNMLASFFAHIGQKTVSVEISHWPNSKSPVGKHQGSLVKYISCRILLAL